MPVYLLAVIILQEVVAVSLYYHTSVALLNRTEKSTMADVETENIFLI